MIVCSLVHAYSVRDSFFIFDWGLASIWSHLLLLAGLSDIFLPPGKLNLRSNGHTVSALCQMSLRTSLFRRLLDTAQLALDKGRWSFNWCSLIVCRRQLDLSVGNILAHLPMLDMGFDYSLNSLTFHVVNTFLYILAPLSTCEPFTTFLCGSFEMTYNHLPRKYVSFFHNLWFACP